MEHKTGIVPFSIFVCFRTEMYDLVRFYLFRVSKCSTCLFLGKDVAVKVVRLDSHTTVPLREENINGLHHKNIVEIIDVLYRENCNYGVVLMEYLPSSKELQTVLDDKCTKLSMEMVIKFGLDICHGLQYCHENGVLHMDVKPANILVINGTGCKLCDFGNSTKKGLEHSTQLLLVGINFTSGFLIQ